MQDASVLAFISWRTVGVIHLGPFAIRTHSVLIGLGFQASVLLMRLRTRRREIPHRRLEQLTGYVRSDLLRR